MLEKECEMISWHSKSEKEIFRELNTSEKGLSKSEAKLRLEKFGFNEISEEKNSNVVIIFLKQFNSPLVYILLITMFISFLFNHLLDGYIILGILIFNAVIGFVQEKKAENAINTLKKIIVSYAKVYRDNTLLRIPSKELVPGDIIYLEEGDKIPADARIIDLKNFRTQESSLTGESFPEDKQLKILHKEVTLADRTNMVFMSTLVVSGTAKAVVVSTGTCSEIGKIASSIENVPVQKTHFSKQTIKLTKFMAFLSIIGALLTFLIGYFINNLNLFEIFFFTIASLVSGIPEGLPAILSVVLAVGALRMTKKNAVIRHLPSIETLGITTVIATDKTGTLTENSLTVEKIFTSQGEFNVTGNGWQSIGKFYQNNKLINPLKFNTLEKLFSISIVSNKSKLIEKNDTYEIIGDPTEASLIVLSKKAGIEKTDSINNKIIDDFPFNPGLRFRATLFEVEKRKKQIYLIGAFEKLIHNSKYILKDKKEKIDEKLKKEFLKQAEKYAKEGYRVLALAYKDSPITLNSFYDGLVTELVIVGIVAMKDPPRKNVKDSIQKAYSAGINVIMITGDHKETAIAIAKEIGMVGNNSLSQSEIDSLSEEDFYDLIKKTTIFSRINPETKLRIVETLQKQGHVVAMTGDGINDAPALKKSDIGISMGIIGTDVARESSEMILTDDNFTSIVNAVEEGRIVFRNVRNASTYLVSTNIAESITIILSLILKLPLPLLPIHLLWMNVITDGFNGISLAFEKSHNTALSEKPKPKNENILNKEIIPYILIVSLVMTISTISFFIYFNNNYGINKAMTAAFVTMNICQLFNVFNMRSMHKSLFEIGLFKNKYVIFSVLFSLLCLFSLIFIPLFQSFFNFELLSWLELLIIFLVSSLVLITGEIYKFIRFKN